MKQAVVKLKSLSPYCQSRFHSTPKKNKEAADAYEERTWIEKAHTRDGIQFIPAMAFKNCLSEAAKYLSLQIPGKGKATYTKHFEAGVLVLEDAPIGSIDGINKHDVYVPSDGVRGSGKRVMRSYPKRESWEATVTFNILDDIITEDVFSHVLKQAGNLIGVGTFRVRNNYIFGRFGVEEIQWTEF